MHLNSSMCPYTETICSIYIKKFLKNCFNLYNPFILTVFRDNKKNIYNEKFHDSEIIFINEHQHRLFFETVSELKNMVAQRLKFLVFQET